MKFNVKVVEEGEVLSNHVGLTLEQLTGIVGGFHIGNLQDLINWKKEITNMKERNDLRIKEVMDSIDWTDYKEMKERFYKGSSDYIGEDE